VARRTSLNDPSPESEWVTVAVAARRLGMSKAWFRAVAKSEGIDVVRPRGQPGVDWASVEAFVARSGITTVTKGDGSLLSTLDPKWWPPGVALIDQVKGRFGWSDHDVADALGVWPSVVSRYRRTGVPKHQIARLPALTRTSPSDVDPPRRLVPKRGAAGLPPSALGPR
jgi:hypothetical protein